MKKYLFISLTILVINILSSNATGQNEIKAGDSDTLCILWTSGDPDVANKMVFMYSQGAIRNGWWKHVEFIVWGPSQQLISENEEIQKEIKKMMLAGIKFDACKACADMYCVSDKLIDVGIDVRYMGIALTEILKSNKKLMTF